jgi:serine protease Do
MQRFSQLVVLFLCTSLLVLRPCIASDEDLAAQEERAMQAAIERVAPSVVRVETVGAVERVADLQTGLGATTGLIVSADGWIVASDFGFATKPESILVTVPDKGRLQAKLIATDHSRKLVLLKVEATDLPVPQAVPAAEVRVGQWAIALGRSYESNSPSVSVGVVSANDRLWGKTIQTDAKISPNNYGGPLVDIQGRVFGVLSALGPEMMPGGGAELYDSGIGFAVPLEGILQVLPRWQQGDLKAGILGINFRGKDMFAEPAVIGAARAGGPGAKSGLKKGDTIVAANGKPVTRQAQFKQIIGPRYAGDQLTVTVERGDKREKVEIAAELVAELPPYVFPFIGIVAERGGKAEVGLPIRYIFAKSAAEVAGLQPGDVLTSIGGNKFANWLELSERLIDYLPGDTVEVAFTRNGQTNSAKLKLGELTAVPPDEPPLALLPAEAAPVEKAPEDDAAVPAPEDDAAKPSDDFKTHKLPEFPNEALVYVPPTYSKDRPHGVLVCFFPPSDFLPERVVPLWKKACADARLILIAPKPQQANEWQPAEVQFARRVFDEVAKSHQVDTGRVAVYGAEAGGAMAYLMAIASRDVVRGVAVVDAALPAAITLPETNPVERLLVWSAQIEVAGPAAVSQLRAINAGVARLEKLRYPTYVMRHTGGARELDEKSFESLVRWFDSLDRL